MTHQKALLLKGIPPGSVIAHALKRQGISQHAFAKLIDVYPQSLNAIIKQKRKLNYNLSLKIEAYFNWEKGSLMILQVLYDLKKIEQQSHAKIDIKAFRPALFWDTDLQKINWSKNKKAIIKRILSRGNEQEKQAIKDFYGQKEVENLTTDD